MQTSIRRSALIMPVHNSKLVEKSYLRDADAICLDLEDSVPASQKETARRSMKGAIGVAGKGGMDVLARINNSASLVEGDLEACVWPGLAGLIIPKVESGEQVRRIAEKVEQFEIEREIPQGTVRFWVVVESAKGVKNAHEIAGSCPERITHMSVGDEDLSLDLGIAPTLEGDEFAYVKSKIVIAARAAGVVPLGLAGTLADFTDLEGLRRSAKKAKSLGFKGAMAIHPSQVPILNEIFSPAPVEVVHAKEVVELFEKALSEGKAAVQVEGKMVDPPGYERAKMLLETAQSIEALDRRKKAALT